MAFASEHFKNIWDSVRSSTTPVQSDRPLCDLTRNRAHGRAHHAANASRRSEWENKGGSPCFNDKNGNAPNLGSPAQRSMARVTRKGGGMQAQGE